MTVSKSKLLFVATEDWFFCSHFMPMLRSAQAVGFDVGVVTRVKNHQTVLERSGAKVLPLHAERASHNPLAALRSVRQLVSIFRAERPDAVHLISLKSIILGGLAARLSKIDRRIYAITGLGLLGAAGTAKSRAALYGLSLILRYCLDGPSVRYLFENEDDAVALRLTSTDPDKVTFVGGAGVALDHFPCVPMPALPPLRVAIVARMLWQKGADLAVEAVSRARAEGVDVQLSLFGMPDTANPRSFTTAELQSWDKKDGITWYGHTRDIPKVWAEHHVCCLPSRGGEGLPRSLLEGAACGRPLVTTDVPGCRSFVEHGVTGVVVKPNDPQPLADAFRDLAGNLDRVAGMGTAARRRVSQRHTEEAIASAIGDLYRKLF
jgi:glycosyltransferase involved in cell wall biosynthesis